MGMERDIKLYGHAKGKTNQQSQILWHKIACRKDISIYKNVKIFKSIKETIWLLDGGTILAFSLLLAQMAGWNFNWN